jgi:hypothetical protein
MQALKSRIGSLIMLGASIWTLSACDGLFDGLYDSADDTLTSSEFGFIEIDPLSQSGTIYIDATSYTRWTYINLHTLTTDTVAICDENMDADGLLREPSDFDFAVHRYDAKTCGGAVYETPYSTFEELRAQGLPSNATFDSDLWTTEQITIDMSQMLDGILQYTPSYYNATLSRWLDVDTSNMPPTYTLSNRVYVLRLADQSMAALRLSNFKSAQAVKGFMTIDYLYPVTFSK